MAGPTVKPPSRRRFVVIIAIAIIADLAFTLLAALPFDLDHVAAASIFGWLLLGPFSYALNASSVGVIGIAYMAGTCLMLFAYLIRPATASFVISVLGALWWTFSAFVLFLSMQ